MDIGKRIKQLRMQNDLTLEELASRTELTKGFLSQLERDQASPSIQTLEDIVEALGVSMSRFFADDAAEQIVFTAKDEFVDERENETVHWIVPNAQKNDMEPIILEILPHQKTRIIAPHEGQEFGYILAGRVYLCTSSSKKGQLVRKGENFYLKGNEAHYLENRTDKTASLLWISTPPAF